jgi:hypothetical protein
MSEVPLNKYVGGKLGCWRECWRSEKGSVGGLINRDRQIWGIGTGAARWRQGTDGRFQAIAMDGKNPTKTSVGKA